MKTYKGIAIILAAFVALFVCIHCSSDDGNGGNGEINMTGCWQFTGSFSECTGTPANICTTFCSLYAVIPGLMDMVQEGNVLTILVQVLDEDPIEVTGTIVDDQLNIEGELEFEDVYLEFDVEGYVFSEGGQLKFHCEWSAHAVGKDMQFDCTGVGTFDGQKSSDQPCDF